jgi:ORF6N domain-containing protein
MNKVSPRNFMGERTSRGSMSALIHRERIEQTILLIRGHRVMLDADLAKLYGVTTFNLNKAVKRNSDRFPEDFMFRLSTQETAALTFQIGISRSRGRGGRRNAPYVFTEQGVAMLSSVLRSKRAIHVNIAIMRAFVKLRELAVSHKALATKLAQLERKVSGHDGQIHSLFDAIRQLMEPPPSKSRRIGFKT